MNMAWRKGWVRTSSDGWGRLRGAVNDDLDMHLSYTVGHRGRDRYLLFRASGSHRLAEGSSLRELVINFCSNRIDP